MDQQQAEQLRHNASIDGLRAGRNGIAFSLNPYQPDDPLYEVWRVSWHQGAAETAARAANERAREPADVFSDFAQIKAIAKSLKISAVQVWRLSKRGMPTSSAAAARAWRDEHIFQ